MVGGGGGWTEIPFIRNSQCIDQLTIGAHWSPLELENMKTGMAKLIQTVITIGAHWSPLELEIEDGYRHG